MSDAFFLSLHTRRGCPTNICKISQLALWYVGFLQYDNHFFCIIFKNYFEWFYYFLYLCVNFKTYDYVQICSSREVELRRNIELFF